MYFIADLHIHSRFSRATAKTLTFPNLYIAAREKGIHVLGTGDFTHPAWFAEIRENLVPAEPGLFRLRPELEAECEKEVRVKTDDPVRFMLTCEISDIYKKNGVTRKTHNLILLPDLDEAARLNSRLDQIGNIRSDGRPILGLDTRDLLEIVLETSETGYLIPAHIWTPWFSMFGSKSGFDRIEECFEDLTPHVFALETGLSSDPPMNWRVGNIDGLTLVSNSDAHSPANLAREANLFDTEMSFPAIREALETGDPASFKGTIEFFPQEGKYHQDGHRKCNVNLHPKQAIAANGICPVCGHPLTLGVLHRVEALATREEGEKPEKTHPYYSVIPLPEILAEIVGTGPKSKKVAGYCQRVLEALGPELAVLHTLPEAAIDAAGIPLLTEAVRRMRNGQVHITPGFDGQYGEVRAFTREERDRLIGQQNLFKMPDSPPPKPKKAAPPEPGGSPEKGPGPANPAAAPRPDPATPEACANDSRADLLSGLNTPQQEAVRHGQGPLMIVAGPGTGKTRTLTCRIARLIQTQTARPDQILALTFTNKAAAEMAERISALCGTAEPPLAATFHAFCHRFLKENAVSGNFVLIDDEERLQLVREAVTRLKNRHGRTGLRAEKALDHIVFAKQQIVSPQDDLSAVAKAMEPAHLAELYETYQQMLESRKLCDYEDLIFNTVALLETDAHVLDRYQERYPYIFVDEYQDLNYGQYRIIRALTRSDGNICVIGDPDQSIYGFRGSDVSFFRRFTEDFPGAAQIRLTRNYRSTETILEAAHQVICGHSLNEGDARVRSGIAGPEALRLLRAPTEAAEAVAIGKTIEAMIGGTGFDFEDFDKKEDLGINENAGASFNEPYHAFSDFAVLFRSRAQGEFLADTFSRAGIPCQMASKQSLWRCKGVQESLACLKLLEGWGSYLDLSHGLSILAPDMAAADIQALMDWGERQGLALNGLLAEADRMRVPGMGASGRSRLTAFLARISAFSGDTTGLTVSEKLAYIGGQPEFEALCQADGLRREAFSRVLAQAAAYGDNTAAFIETAALQSDPDVYDKKSQKVALLTLHAAKGLEFPVVFVAGCEAGLIPLQHGQMPPENLDEERRLFYVAMTRARTLLYLTQAQSRRIYGKNENRTPSPFLQAIDRRLIRDVQMAARPKQAAQQQLNLF